MNKKGSLTLFLIIGLVVIILISFVLYTSNSAEKIVPKNSKIKLQIKDMMTDCLTHNTNKAIKLLSSHGGYIDITNGDFNGLKLSFDNDATESEAVFIGNKPVAFWSFLKSKNDCTTCIISSNNTVSIQTVEKQISNYLEVNAVDCFKKLNIFYAFNISYDYRKFKVNTKLTRDSVVVSAHLPIDFNSDQENFHIDKFIIDVPVRLKSMIELANQIKVIEDETQFLEISLFSIIQRYSGVEVYNVPPVEEITHDEKITKWNQLLVKQQITDILTQYVPLLRFNKTIATYNTKNKNNEYKNGYLKSFIISGVENADQRLRVVPLYFGWDPYLKITPNDDGILRPSVFKSKFPYGISGPYIINNYEFFYDLSFPVVFEITDLTARENTSSRFYFALESNLRDNVPMKSWNQGDGTLGYWDASRATVNLKLSLPEESSCSPINLRDANSKYKCKLTERVYNTVKDCVQECVNYKQYHVPKIIENVTFCNEYQNVGSALNLTLINKRDGGFVKDAEIRYKCGNYDSCRFKRVKNKVKFPTCIGGIISVSADNYLTYERQFDSFPKINKSMTIKMVPYLNFSVDVAIKEIRNLNDNQFSILRNLSDNEMVSISVHPTSNISKTQAQFLIIENNSELRNELLLIPGDYVVEAKLIDFNGVTIGRNCMGVCEKRGFLKKICKKYRKLPSDAKEIKPLFIGGSVLDIESGLWKISEKNMSSTKITIPIIRLPRPNCVQSGGEKPERLGPDTADKLCYVGKCIGVNEALSMQKYSNKFRRNLEPIFSGTRS